MESCSDVHKKALSRICRRCAIVIAGKKSTLLLTEVIRNDYKVFFGIDLDNDNPFYGPQVLCSTCRTALSQLKNGKELSQISKSLTPSPLLSNVGCDSKPITRSQQTCSNQDPCYICNIFLNAPKQGQVSTLRKIKLQNPPGRKRKAINLENVTPPPRPCCNTCFKELTNTEIVSSMKKHVCLESPDRVIHALNVLEKSGIQDCIISQGIQKAVLDHEGIIKISTGQAGRPMIYKVGHSTQVQKGINKLELKALVGLKTLSNCISNNVLKKINGVMEGVKFPCIQKYYSQKNACIGKLFDQIMVEMENSEGRREEVKFVYCVDIVKLIQIWWTGYGDGNVIKVKLSFDSGQDFLKFGIQILNDIEHSNSINDFLLVVVVQAIETRNNLLQIFSLPCFKNLLTTDSVQVFLSGDLKCFHLVAGMSTGNCKYPCVYCTWSPSDGITATHQNSDHIFLRDGEFHAKNVLKFNTEYSGDFKHAKHVFNCIHDSVFQSEIGLNLFHFCMPMLHITLGITKKFLDVIESQLCDEEKDVLTRSLKRIGIIRSPYHGGALEGRQCRKLLKNIDSLPIPDSPPKQVLLKFNELLTSVGGLYRSDDWQKNLDDLYLAFNESNVNPFEKMHLLTHICDILYILDSINTCENKPGLSWTSEQAIESSHQHFKKTWERYIKMPKNTNLMEAVVDFNYDRFITAFSRR